MSGSKGKGGKKKKSPVIVNDDVASGDDVASAVALFKGPDNDDNNNNFAFTWQRNPSDKSDVGSKSPTMDIDEIAAAGGAGTGAFSAVGAGAGGLGGIIPKRKGGFGPSSFGLGGVIPKRKGGSKRAAAPVPDIDDDDLMSDIADIRAFDLKGATRAALSRYWQTSLSHYEHAVMRADPSKTATKTNCFTDAHFNPNIESFPIKTGAAMIIDGLRAFGKTPAGKDVASLRAALRGICKSLISLGRLAEFPVHTQNDVIRKAGPAMAESKSADIGDKFAAAAEATLLNKRRKIHFAAPTVMPHRSNNAGRFRVRNNNSNMVRYADCCWEFNDKRGCKKLACKRKHVCGLCGGDHSATVCNKK